MRIQPILLVIQMLFVNYCVCWWDTGHMLVAKVAELTLMKEDKESFILAEKITNILNIFSHGVITNFIESACWPDDVKKFGLQSMDKWHFLDLPVRLDSFKEKANIAYKLEDALGTIHQCYKILTKWTHQEVRDFQTQFEKSMMARYLVHVVGDVHQPLHSSTLINKKFPDGDQGGNLFPIQFKENIQNLHKLFDSILDGFKNDIDRPLTKEDSQYLEKIATEIMQEFEKGDLPELKSTDFADWLQESHDISQNFIYREIQIDSAPSEEYIRKGFKMAKRRIALGGYRLAELFKHIYQAFENPVVSSNDETEISRPHFRKIKN